MVKSGRNSSTMEKETLKTRFSNRDGACGFQMVSSNGDMAFVDNSEDARKYKSIADHMVTISLGMAGMNVRATKGAFQQIR